MKNLFTTGMFLFLFITVNAQNQSMTITHSGISANDTLWVVPGEMIDFIYGSGGTHPMTTGQGSTPSPIFFPTVTVSSSVPLQTFSLTTIGTYIFHCGTNPGNTDNWGTIIVQEAASIDEQKMSTTINVYPNPAADLISIGLNETVDGDYIIFDLSGNIVLNGAMSEMEQVVNISSLEKGTYFLKIESISGSSMTSFIKQ
jgi:hypothetical protein